MYRQTIIAISLILCVLGARAEDSIKVSAADLQALIQRVERLEQKDSLSQQVGSQEVLTSTPTNAERQEPRRGL